MTTDSNIESIRYHSFDVLRATAMLLGIVFHVALSFVPTAREWWIVEDSQTDTSYYYLYFFLKSFRMPLFFVMAGFFGNMLYCRRGLGRFVGHRLVRIVLPLVAGLLTIVPIIHFLYIYRPFHGSIMDTHSEYVDTCVSYLFSSEFLMNFAPAHLWFLYYLLMLYVIAVVISKIFSGAATTGVDVRVDKIVSWLIRTPVKPFLFAMLITIPLSVMSKWSIDTPDKGFAPEWHILLYYGVFFMFGWLVYRRGGDISKFTRYSGLYVLAAALVLPLAVYMQQFQYQPDHDSYAALKLCALLSLSCLTCSMVFGLTGLFQKYFNKHNHLVRYVSDSSYWLYLVHLPIVMYFQVVLAENTLPSVVKFLLINAAALMICFLTYRYLVRYTFIGSVLNGPKEKRLSD